MQLLQDQGYEPLSVSMIAERAGVHETSLYRRWGTKEQLVVAAITSQVARDIPIPDTGTLRSDLIQLLQFLRAFLLSPLGHAIAQTAIATTRVPALNALHTDIWQRRRTHLQIIFERALTRGEISAQADSQLLFEALISVFYTRLFLFNEQIDEALPEQIVDLILPGVCPNR